MSMICESILTSIDQIDAAVMESDLSITLSLINVYHKDLMIMEAATTTDGSDDKSAIKWALEKLNKLKELFIRLFEKFLNFLKRKFGRQKMDEVATNLENIDKADIPIADAEVYSEPKFHWESAPVVQEEDIEIKWDQPKNLPKFSEIRFEFRNKKLVLWFDLKLFIDTMNVLRNGLFWSKPIGVFKQSDTASFSDLPKPIDPKVLYAEHEYGFAQAALLFRKLGKKVEEVYKWGNTRVEELKSFKSINERELKQMVEDRETRFDISPQQAIRRLIANNSRNINVASNYLATVQAIDIELVRVADRISAACKSILRNSIKVKDSDNRPFRTAALAAAAT